MTKIGNTNSDNLHVLRRLSTNAMFSIAYAVRLSKSEKSPQMTVRHLALGVLSNPSGLARRVLQAMQLNIDEILSVFIPQGGRHIRFTRQGGTLELDKLSPAAEESIYMAYQYAIKASHVYVGTEHLLLAIFDKLGADESRKLGKLGLTKETYTKALAEVAKYPLGTLAKPPTGDIAAESSADSALETFGQDLVELAKEGKLDPLVGRTEELKQLINILSRRRKNNPIIIGPPGVGKTALVEGLAQMIATDSIPASLLATRIVSLDLPAITAGSKLRGDIEEKVMAIIAEVIRSDDVILFIDEIHLVMGTQMPGAGGDIASILKPVLMRDDFRVIGATTTSEYTAYFENDEAMARRFQTVQVGEPSIDESIEILKRIEPILEEHHNVNIPAETVEVAVKLADRYVSNRYLPDKAIDLLDEASAAKRIEMEEAFEDVMPILQELKKAVQAKEEALKEGDFDTAHRWRMREQELMLEIDKIQVNRSLAKNRNKYKVGKSVLEEVVSKWTGIPVSTLNVAENKMLLNLEKTLGKYVIGQDEALETVANAIRRARTGISSPNRPWASMLFLGPTGVGKTELAKVLTRTLFGSDERLIQIDMSELMETHSVSKLIGSPPGYVGYREGGKLTEQVRRNPHSIILFDEIEKAHPDVLNILLQIMEDGHLTDGRGRKVSFKNTVVILTSNIGAEEIRQDKVLGFSGRAPRQERSDREILNAYKTMKTELLDKLKDTLRPELLNRIDATVIFKALTRTDAKKIVSVLLQEFNERIADLDVSVELDKDAVKYIVREGFSEEYGARPLRRVFQDNLETAVAQEILKHRKANDKLVLKFSADNDRGLYIK